MKICIEYSNLDYDSISISEEYTVLVFPEPRDDRHLELGWYNGYIYVSHEGYTEYPNQIKVSLGWI